MLQHLEQPGCLPACIAGWPSSPQLQGCYQTGPHSHLFIRPPHTFQGLLRGPCAGQSHPKQAQHTGALTAPEAAGSSSNVVGSNAALSVGGACQWDQGGLLGYVIFNLDSITCRGEGETGMRKRGMCGCSTPGLLTVSCNQAIGTRSFVCSETQQWCVYSALRVDGTKARHLCSASHPVSWSYMM